MRQSGRGQADTGRGCQLYRICVDTMTKSQLSGDEFLAAFESATPADFHHADHVQAAWIYLERLPFQEASRRMAVSVKHFAAWEPRSFSLPQRDSVLFDVGRHARIEVGSGRPRWNVVEHFSVFNAVHPAQFAVYPQNKFPDVVAVGAGII